MIRKKKVSKGYMILRKRKRAKKEADWQAEREWQRAVDEQANYRCEKCGGVKFLEHHHVFGRRYKSIVHDPENGVLLCSQHHVPWAHAEPKVFQLWIRLLRGEDWWRRLLDKRNAGQGINNGTCESI